MHAWTREATGWGHCHASQSRSQSQTACPGGLGPFSSHHCLRCCRIVGEGGGLLVTHSLRAHRVMTVAAQPFPLARDLPDPIPAGVLDGPACSHGHRFAAHQLGSLRLAAPPTRVGFEGERLRKSAARILHIESVQLPDVPLSSNIACDLGASV